MTPRRENLKALIERLQRKHEFQAASALVAMSARLDELEALLTASPAAPEGETPRDHETAETFWKLVADGINHHPQCSNHFAGDPRWGECLRCQVEKHEARALATPPAPPAPELDFVNAQTPLEPEARAILNRNRAELYLGPPAPVATYDANFGNDKVCACGHTYFRHFDTYDGMRPVGCKYCDCVIWRRPDEGRR